MFFFIASCCSVASLVHSWLSGPDKIMPSIFWTLAIFALVSFIVGMASLFWHRDKGQLPAKAESGAAPPGDEYTRHREWMRLEQEEAQRLFGSLTIIKEPLVAPGDNAAVLKTAYDDHVRDVIKKRTQS